MRRSAFSRRCFSPVRKKARSPSAPTQTTKSPRAPWKRASISTFPTKRCRAWTPSSAGRCGTRWAKSLRRAKKPRMCPRSARTGLKSTSSRRPTFTATTPPTSFTLAARPFPAAPCCSARRSISASRIRSCPSASRATS